MLLFLLSTYETQSVQTDIDNETYPDIPITYVLLGMYNKYLSYQSLNFLPFRVDVTYCISFHMLLSLCTRTLIINC